MKELTTFFQICIYITIAMVLFTLSISFVSAMGVFQTEIEAGVVAGEDTNATMQGFTVSPDYPSGMDMTTLWGIVITASAAGGIVIAWITRSTTILGVYVFSVVFWAAYGNALSVINSMGGSEPYLSGLIGLGFVSLATVGIGFIWIGAIAGMLSGSG